MCRGMACCCVSSSGKLSDWVEPRGCSEWPTNYCVLVWVTRLWFSYNTFLLTSSWSNLTRRCIYIVTFFCKLFSITFILRNLAEAPFFCRLFSLTLVWRNLSDTNIIRMLTPTKFRHDLSDSFAIMISTAYSYILAFWKEILLTNDCRTPNSSKLSYKTDFLTLVMK